ncbi:hypothetical protein PN499_08375 [Kamptonema animale CS-326]|jgi:hypothetical protein|uniref:hypothetical protein n=1 Tax=Kamptonema animale TaxID=92934 RepID=UPI00232B78B8|nr:hypothetical protein [Kamptonema animale]MDB9511195.1 hypothetical protein [Kamptonema animale CS-326]
MPVLTIETLYDDLWNILQNEGNKEDFIAFMLDRNLPIDEIEAANILNSLNLKALKLALPNPSLSPQL